MSTRIDLVIGGVHKCGSTSLYRALAQHEQVFASEAGESRAFTLAPSARDAHLLALFAPSTARVNLLSWAHTSAVPEVLDALARYPSRPRLLLVLRDPVERAWSAYRFARHNGWEDLDIHAALDAEAARAEGDLHQRTDLQYVANSRLSLHLLRAQQHLGAERVGAVWLDDLLAGDGLVAVQRFAGLPTQPLSLPHANEAAASRWPALRHWLLGESLGKRALRSALPPRAKQQVHRHLTRPLLRWNRQEAPPAPMPDDVRQRLERLLADELRYEIPAELAISRPRRRR